MDLSTSSNRSKVSFIQICFRSLLSLKQVCCVYFECICEAMLDSMDFLDKTFAERFVLVLLSCKTILFSYAFRVTNTHFFKAV